MAKGFIESNVARGNRNLLMLSLVLILVGGGLAAGTGRWFPAVIGLAGVIMLGSWLKRVLNSSGHPIYKRLAAYGDPQQLAQQVNREFAEVKPSDTTHFSKNWLAQGEAYGLSLVPWSDIAWLHTYTKTQGGIRTSCYVRVWSRDGKQFVAPAGVRPGEVEQLLEELRARAPWAEVGYSPELQQEWNKRRVDFLARVDARRIRYQTDVAARRASAHSQA
jgi:Family of unknown function (DUF6709)